MKHKRYTEKSYGFFSRMLLVCTALLTAFSIISSVIVSHLSSRYEQTLYLKSYDLAAANLLEAFDSRVADFNILAGKFLSDGQCDPRLCALLETPSYEEIPAETRNYCTRLLAGICRDDRYLRGFLIFSPEKETLYYYTESRSYLFHTTPPEVRTLVPFSGSLLDLDTVGRLVAACDRESAGYSAFYGMAATLYHSPVAPLGYMIPLYSTSEYTDILSNYDLKEQSAFLITDEAGNLFFHSNPGLSLNEDSCYTDTLRNSKYGFQVTYYTRKYGIPISSVTCMIILFAVLVTLFSFFLYYVTYYLSHRNIYRILDGMKRFSLNDLTYRIEKPSGHNEFTQIIDGFNTMCEELQRNVELSYVYELQQKKSELYALQTSINPHFLYNTLEIIRTQILSLKPADASQMILLLSRIYRNQITSSMFITLGQEVELCENLMLLYQYRFQNFEYEFDMDGQISRYALPKNTLQPLIENYFVHGIVTERQDNLFFLSIKSSLRQEKHYIHMTLGNNGHPISEERIQMLEEKLQSDSYTKEDTVGFALTNVNSRMRIVFQEDYSMHISSGKEDMQFQIELHFPAMTAEQLKAPFL
ncbi:histidine kinase [Acetatifactor muris]|uniref:Sensor histidine kinase YpdA n=1 Tax=Acetatifactor muris TaxID=879566 RepID=A0A2K4ZMW7_9FIRM|nr:histidine kinase [Acetatifactor muris]MCR2050172.1 histidine kinase [Acetatifactor muris]SOY31834.1 Sensor histidine kinase YpdA [Acetatifactor muris]